MTDIGRILMFIGVAIFTLGVLLAYTDRIPFLGKLPGDILIRRDGFTFYFPLATSIVISVLLTVIIKVVEFIRNQG